MLTNGQLAPLSSRYSPGQHALPPSYLTGATQLLPSARPAFGHNNAEYQAVFQPDLFRKAAQT